MPSQKSSLKERIEEQPVQPGSYRVGVFWILGLVLLLFAVFIVFFESYFLPVRVPLEGTRALQAIRAPYDFVFDEARALRALVDKELAEYVPIYQFDALKAQDVPARVETLFNGISKCREKASTSRSRARKCLGEVLNTNVSDSVATELFRYQRLDDLKESIKTFLIQLLETGIVAEAEMPERGNQLRVRFSRASEPEARTLVGVTRLADARAQVDERPEFREFSEGLAAALSRKIGGLLEPSLHYAEENRNLLEAIRSKASGGKRIFYHRGDLLVRSGHMVKPLDLYRVQDCLAQFRADSLWVGAATFLLFFFLTLVFLMVFQRVGDEVAFPAQAYLLVFFSLLSVLLVSKGMNLFTNVQGFALPIGAAGLLVAQMLDLPLALLTALLAALYASFLTTLDMGLFIYYLVGGVCLVLCTARTSKRMHLLVYSLLIGIVNVGLLVCILLLQDKLFLNEGFENAGLPVLRELVPQAFMSAPVAWLLTILLTPLCEKLFRLASAERFRELTDLNHPLLKKLQDKAPGTYYHSLAVANLAAAAAESVKADVLLVRAAAYFHDIGKILQPEFFVENQKKENPHDTLEPGASYEIIKAHVVDGVAIAEEYRFPQAVIDLIAEHHGTTVMEAFFSKAQQSEPERPCNRDYFRYGGPRPYRMEAGILMIADIAEAMGRVLKTQSLLEVREAVHRMIVNRFEDGQFDRCGFSTRTLAQIERAVTQALVGVLHKRLDYPDANSQKSKKPTPPELE